MLELVSCDSGNLQGDTRFRIDTLIINETHLD